MRWRIPKTNKFLLKNNSWKELKISSSYLQLDQINQDNALHLSINNYNVSMLPFVVSYTIINYKIKRRINITLKLFKSR